MNRESRLSGVPALLLADKLELVSKDVDNDPLRNPLETEGERVEGEETFDTVFLVTLLALLSSDVDETLFAEEEDREEEADNVGLTEGLRYAPEILTSDAVEVLILFSEGDMGTDFLIPETLDPLVGFVDTEGKELLLSSGRDFLTGSTTAVLFFLAPTTEAPFGPCFSEDTPPVLFRLMEVEVRKEEVLAVVVGFVAFELDTGVSLDSALFLAEPLGANSVEVGEIIGLVSFFATFLVVSLGLTVSCTCVI